MSRTPDQILRAAHTWDGTLVRPSEHELVKALEDVIALHDAAIAEVRGLRKFLKHEKQAHKEHEEMCHDLITERNYLKLKLKTLGYSGD